MLVEASDTRNILQGTGLGWMAQPAKVFAVMHDRPEMDPQHSHGEGEKTSRLSSDFHLDTTEYAPSYPVSHSVIKMCK